MQFLPRIAGDVDDPRGGIRFAVSPAVGNYLTGTQ